MKSKLEEFIDETKESKNWWKETLGCNQEELFKAVDKDSMKDMKTATL